MSPAEYFNKFWDMYPRKDKPREANIAFFERISDGVPPSKLIAAAINYSKECKKKGRTTECIFLAKNFLSTEYMNYCG